MIFFFGMQMQASAQLQPQILSDNQLSELKKIILKSINTLHPDFTPSGFKGSYDWHSDVHAHWALLSMARVTKDQHLEEKVLSKLSLEKIKNEYRFLTTPNWSEFEKPYGRAWFLLLLKELSLHEIGKEPEFEKIRTNLTNEMLNWLMQTPFPDFDNSGKINGQHNSWLMSLFLVDLATKDLPINAKIKDLVINYVVPNQQIINQSQMDKNDFIYLPSLAYILNPNASKYTGSILNPPASGAAQACHQAGAIQVSLWAYADQCANYKDQNSCDLVLQTSQIFFNNHKLWKNNFDCVSHWVPQFQWMTYWLSQGRP
jgi:hypothetical protein